MISNILSIAFMYIQIVVFLMYIYAAISPDHKYWHSKTFNWLIIGTCIIGLVTHVHKCGNWFDIILIMLNAFVVYGACKRLSENDIDTF